MFIKFSELPIPYRYRAEEYEYFRVNQLDALLSSGMSDDLMSKTVEEDWMVLV